MILRLLQIFLLGSFFVGLVGASVCEDSDGGLNIYNKGHLEDLDHGNAVYDDSCANLETADISEGWTPVEQGNMLVEYYCGDTNYQYTVVECENGCMGGKCMPEGTNEDGCKDSDGINFYYKGVVQGSEDGEDLTGEDYCRDGPYNVTYLVEYYCNDETGSPAILTISCSNGCSDGVCLGDSNEMFECEDSDGEDLFVKGYIEGLQYQKDEEDFFDVVSYYDSCSEKQDGAVVEYYCSSGMVSSKTVECEFGCYDGACLTEDSDVVVSGDCYDSDFGKDYYLRGEIYSDGVYHNEDKCSDDKTLNEWFCEDGVYDVVSYECEGMCSNGRCYDSEEDVEVENEMEVEGDIVIEGSKICSGCEFDGECYGFGYRKDGNYCSDSGEFLIQLEGSLVCENDFECVSNLCIDGECIDSSLWRKFLDFFARFF